jgi:hypothetical protein
MVSSTRPIPNINPHLAPVPNQLLFEQRKLLVGQFGLALVVVRRQRLEELGLHLAQRAVLDALALEVDRAVLAAHVGFAVVRLLARAHQRWGRGGRLLLLGGRANGDDVERARRAQGKGRSPVLRKGALGAGARGRRREQHRGGGSPSSSLSSLSPQVWWVVFELVVCFLLLSCARGRAGVVPMARWGARASN